MIRVQQMGALGLILASTILLGIACGGGDSAQKQAPPTAVPTTTPTAAPLSPPAPSQSKELTLVKAVRPAIANTVAALEKGDLAAARVAWATYDPLWNGMEIYINHRSLPTYQDLENNWQAKINTALAAPDARAADVLPLAQSLLATWDEAIMLVETGPAISPLFDEVADIRVARLPLRQVPSALAANDLPKAKASFTAFTESWPRVNGLFRTRSIEAFNETEAAIAAVNTAWAKASPAAAELNPLVSTLTNRYNYGLNLVTTAARRADLSKITYSQDDVNAAAGMASMATELKAGLTLWESGKFTDSSASVQLVGDMFTTWAGALKTKTADTALKTALDAYAALASAAGDAVKVRDANKAAVEAVAVAQQALVGQFWTDSSFQAALAAAPK